MSLSKPQKEGLTATLSKPEDFLNWEHEFLLQAHRLGLQQHLKSKTFLGDEPAIPDIRKRRYTKTATAQRTIRSHTAESQDGAPDDIQETANGTWSISDLTDQGQKIFQQDLTFYQLQEKVFEKQKTALGTLQDWVIRTVSPSLIQTCCQSNESIYEWHRNLRARCGRTEEDETKDARNRYLTLLRTAPKTVSQAAFKWLDQWEEAMAKGRQREVPETLHNSAWAWDFFSVTTHILPSWTASYKISSKTLLQNRALSYRDVGNAFRNELQDAEATKGRVARGAFSASYAGEDPQDDEGDAHIIEAFVAHRFSSYTKKAPLTGEAIRWHSRLGHPGPQALEHLISASQGVRIRGPTTVECDACGISKIKRQIRRAPRQSDQKAGERIAIDFHDYQEGIGGYTSQMLLTCRATGYIWDYYLTARTTEAIITAFKSFLSHLEVQHGLKVKVIECDNEITEIKPKIGDFLRNRAIIIEPSAPYTQAQNGGAERSGGVVKDKERAMRTGAKLPHQLWPEIGRTAVYLYNRTPNYASGWKTPYDQLHTASAKAAGIPQPKKQPDQTHLRAFGCKAYAMTSDAQQKVNRKMRLKPKGWIGFLVGYRSSNIYRIWIPTINRIVNTRDVIFNEDEGCNGDWESFKDELLEADLEEIAKFVQGSSLPEQDDNEQAEQVEDCIEVALPTTTLADESSPITDETEDCIVATALENSLKQSEDSDILPTPPVTPLSALLAHSSRALSDEGNKTVSWQAAFLAGTKSPLQTSIERKLRQGVKMHRNSLPPPPTKHQDLKHHPFGMLFQEAEESHLQSHKEMRSWTEIRKKDARAVDQQVLGCMWVYVYKFDKHGRFQKCKARLVVRGDQQAKGRLQETYAATLAGRSFRTLIAIAARFDLEMVQYDVVNAFVNAPIDQDIFMHMAPGYKKTATILKLNKALYGLRASPLLWQKELSKTLLEIGYTQIPHEPCCFKKEGVLFFFYVDDVIIAYRKARKDKADELTRQLGSKYKLTGGDPVQWFLGMEVIRDRPARKIWLSQTAYIDKIANLANKGTSTVPMTQTELRPQTGLAAPAEIQRYQRKVGSILYIAVNTRPDIAFAASRLARFLVNPGQEHQDAADRVIHYLSHTRHRALRFGGPGGLTVASDASFADNTLDRKSSQAYTIRLFDGLIGWRASKQNTVTTSTTEAELLALAQAAKESLYVSRLLKELTVQMDDPTIRIDCDNTQTINLVTAEIATLKTKLRHVDIHNHWLRQEVQGGRIQVKYTKSTDMIADGLTKALPAGKWNRFLYQLGLEDIQERQQQSRKQEGIEARLQKIEDCLGNAGSTGTY
ncbi:hypothetical protein HZS61_006334 [Fusarium oxysporum f. sp. conglutinans]|uniref:Integrase catalytic domain-containing protein n=1 Tax=Fusarium oxysporum f. sp. conglutinans TaxID=100902 RepID=A0A8H6G9S6_FUSOX|nr:hypothetical protein HZS61_006334 [Fusarium oxysporum f. sp. conglutinans]